MSNHSEIRRGSKGHDVEVAQQALHDRGIYTGRIDGNFGPITEAAVKCYQFQRSRANGGWMAVRYPTDGDGDGVVGKNTWFRLDPDQIKQGAGGDAVKLLQYLLQCNNCYLDEIDGQFGPKTDEALRKFQGMMNLNKDGIAGHKTWAALRS